MRVVASPELLMPAVIDRQSDVPLHRQVYVALRSAILDGRLLPGARVPSTRWLASDLGISRFPVLSAYEQLLHEGYFEGRVGSGTYVRAAPTTHNAGTADATAQELRPRRWLGEGGTRPFRTSLPALDRFPTSLWARLVGQSARKLTAERMTYGDPCGLAALRAAIAERLRVARGVRCTADQVLVVPGSQAALRLCAAVLVERSARVAMEEPGYIGARAAFEAHGAQVVPVPVDDDGLEVGALEAFGSGVRAAYVTPSHQYPLGSSMSATRRLDVIRWAARHDAWILEDDYDSDFRYVSRPVGAMQGMDRTGRVVYLGTFSKSIFPALRLGFVVVPHALWEPFVAAREALDIFPPVVAQMALATFLEEGHFARHIRRMHGVYVRRRSALLEGLRRECAGLLTVHNADAGLHVSTFLADSLEDRDVVARMARMDLVASPLSSCYAGPHPRSGLLLGFGGSDETELLTAARTLGAILRGMGGSNHRAQARGGQTGVS
jgi:GntR family transcriptional regulator / MocR family aminotransferase